MKRISCVLLTAMAWNSFCATTEKETAQPMATLENDKNPRINVNLTVANSHDARAQNQTSTSADQSIQPQAVQEKILIVRQEQSSLASRIMNGAISTAVGAIVIKIMNSKQVQDGIDNIISKIMSK